MPITMHDSALQSSRVVFNEKLLRVVDVQESHVRTDVNMKGCGHTK